MRTRGGESLSESLSSMLSRPRSSSSSSSSIPCVLRFGMQRTWFLRSLSGAVECRWMMRSFSASVRRSLSRQASECLDFWLSVHFRLLPGWCSPAGKPSGDDGHVDKTDAASDVHSSCGGGVRNPSPGSGPAPVSSQRSHHWNSSSFSCPACIADAPRASHCTPCRPLVWPLVTARGCNLWIGDFAQDRKDTCKAVKQLRTRLCCSFRPGAKIQQRKNGVTFVFRMPAMRALACFTSKETAQAL